MANDKPAKGVEHDPGRAERWIRRGLEPDHGTVERIVRRSLSAESTDRRRPRVLAAVAGLAVVVLAVAIAIFVPRIGPSTGADAVEGERSVELLTITNVSGEIEVLYPRGDPGGGPGRARIFNRNGIVAFIARAGASHNFIVGGGS